MVWLIVGWGGLGVYGIPHNGPVAAVRMGRVDGKLVVNPPVSNLENSDISLVIAATTDSIVMLVGGAYVVDEETILEALFTAHEEMRAIFELQNQLKQLAGKPKREFTPKVIAPEVIAAVKERVAGELEEALKISGKKERSTALYALSDRVVDELSARFPNRRHQPPEPGDTSNQTRGA